MAVRFGLLGAGRIGKVHARAITGNPDARLVAVADAVAPAAEALAGQYGAEVRAIDAIAAAGDVDAVVICTPTDTHADLIEQFAAAGKAIFCEKPIDLDVARVQACLKVVARTGAQLMVGFNRRFDPHFRAVRKAIDDGSVGKVEMVNITSRDPGAPPVDYISALGRHLPRHDDPRLRHGALAPRRGAGGGGGLRRRADRPGDRPRPATSTASTSSWRRRAGGRR